MTRLLDEPDLETPEVDAAEQAVSAVPVWADDSEELSAQDLEEQDRVVTFDDDYR